MRARKEASIASLSPAITGESGVCISALAATRPNSGGNRAAAMHLDRVVRPQSWPVMGGLMHVHIGSEAQ
jgi:hypothetical protein